MAHFAKVENGTVVQVIVADQEFIDSGVVGHGWIQTSYNTKGNVHYGQDGNPDGGVALRGNYAGLGFTYDEANDVFYAPSPFPSWILNTSTWTWEAPVAFPQDGKLYLWDEPTLAWIETQPMA
jgi:hypothetical protein